MELLLKLERQMVKIEEFFMITTLLALTSLQITQVVFRYFLNRPLHWVDELSRFVFIWMIMIGAGLAMAKAAHFSIDFVKEAMPKVPRIIAHVVAQASVILFALIIIVHGARLLKTASRQMTAALRIPFWVPYAAIPIGSVLILYHALMAIPARLHKHSGGEL